MEVGYSGFGVPEGLQARQCVGFRPVVNRLATLAALCKGEDHVGRGDDFVLLCHGTDPGLHHKGHDVTSGALKGDVLVLGVRAKTRGLIAMMRFSLTKVERVGETEEVAKPFSLKAVLICAKVQ